MVDRLIVKEIAKNRIILVFLALLIILSTGCEVPGQTTTTTTIRTTTTTHPVSDRLADYGDAPDNQTIGDFPSLRLSNGSRHYDITQAWLGRNVSSEKDSRQVDLDDFDDGLQSRDPVSFDVYNNKWTDDLFINILIDYNQDGDWENQTKDGPDPNEWAVRNMPVDVPVGNLRNFRTNVTHPDETWMRLTLTSHRLKDYFGEGEFDMGESEDYYFERTTTTSTTTTTIIITTTTTTTSTTTTTYIPPPTSTTTTIIVIPPPISTTTTTIIDFPTTSSTTSSTSSTTSTSTTTTSTSTTTTTSSTSTSTTTSSTTTTEAKPDLYTTALAANIGLSASTTCNGNDCTTVCSLTGTVNLKIANAGGAAAGASTAKVEIAPGVGSKTTSIEALSPGAVSGTKTVVLTKSATVPGKAEACAELSWWANEYTVTVTADSTNAVSESDETNNALSSTSTAQS